MRFAKTAGLFVVASLVVGGAQVAHAQAALDDSGKTPARTTDAHASPDTLATSADEVQYGIDIRIRQVFVPKALLQLFLERAAGGASNTGFGVDLVRKRGNLELQLGLEYEHINVGSGIWINKGDNLATGADPDYVLSPDQSGNQFGWFTLEFTFINHAVINKYLAFRYGGGVGLGIITGELDHYNIHCGPGATNSMPEPACTPPRFDPTSTAVYTDPSGVPLTSEQKYAYSMPPVFPVVNALIGLQIRPADKVVINIEGGIRTIPYFGMSAGYFF